LFQAAAASLKRAADAVAGRIAAAMKGKRAEIVESKATG
jgi:hypothetical protein